MKPIETTTLVFRILCFEQNPSQLRNSFINATRLWNSPLRKSHIPSKRYVQTPPRNN